jgi:hypothetical protein
MAVAQMQVKKASLEEVTRELLAALNRGGSSAEVGSILMANPGYLSAASASAAPLPQDGNPYSRKILFNGPEGEAMIAHWPAGKACLPHDHGNAHGLVTILSGHFIEQAFRVSGQGLAICGPSHRFDTGSAIPVAPHIIHSMRAESEGITLHLYVPAVKKMKVYDEHHAYTVADNCGAWIPADPTLILHRGPIGGDSLHD